MAELARSNFHKPPDQLGPEQIPQHQLFLIKDQQASQSTCVQLVCALRFLYTHTLRRKIEIERIPFPRLDEHAPTSHRKVYHLRIWADEWHSIGAILLFTSIIAGPEARYADHVLTRSENRADARLDFGCFLGTFRSY